MEEKINRISEEQIARIREIMKEKSEDYVNNPKKLKEMYIQRGLEQGLEQGLEKGLEKGLKKGLKQGRNEGLNEGLERGRNEGLKKGIEQEKTRQEAKQKSMILAMHEKLSIEEISDLIHMSVDEITQIIQ